jgi:hypothetical protein
VDRCLTVGEVKSARFPPFWGWGVARLDSPPMMGERREIPPVWDSLTSIEKQTSRCSKILPVFVLLGLQDCPIRFANSLEMYVC